MFSTIFLLVTPAAAAVSVFVCFALGILSALAATLSVIGRLERDL